MKLFYLFNISLIFSSLFSYGQKIIKKDDKKAIAKTGTSKIQDDRLMFLNAYNFDFGSTSLSSNYVGHINLFAPSLTKQETPSEGSNKSIKMKQERFGWGFNTGILKINYNQRDSSNRFQNFKENVFINPFDELTDGVKFLKQINNYKVETKTTVWSFYLQPTFELTKASNEQHIYAHFHAELLATKWSSKTQIVNVQQSLDTGVYSQNGDPNIYIRNRLSTEISTSSNTLSGYFGIGATFDLKPWERGSFFFQPTIGYTTNKPGPSSTDISTNIRNPVSSVRPSSIFGKTWNSFYLVRAYYTHSIAKKAEKDGATIVLGIDIRGLFPFYAPQYAAYVGLNVGFDSILDLVSGENKEED